MSKKYKSYTVITMKVEHIVVENEEQFLNELKYSSYCDAYTLISVDSCK